MTSDKINRLKERFSNLDKFEDPKEEIEHDKMMSMFSFLSDVQKLVDKRGWSRKRLANEIGVTPSYLSQLYSGDKVINLEMITKITRALECNFEIKLDIPESSFDKNTIKKLESQKSLDSKSRGLWVYHNLKKPSYNGNEKHTPKISKRLTA